MTKLLLKRDTFTEKYTIGKLYVDGVYFCDILEDKVRDEGVKVYGETAIPHGTYKVAMTMSPKFKRILPRLINVPMFEGILIHRGNTQNDSLGCLLCGNRSVDRVVNSTITEEKLVNILKDKNDIEITIENG